MTHNHGAFDEMVTVCVFFSHINREKGTPCITRSMSMNIIFLDKYVFLSFSTSKYRNQLLKTV